MFGKLDSNLSWTVVDFSLARGLRVYPKDIRAKIIRENYS